METWADDSSILFPWGNLLQKGMVRKQRRGLSSGRGLLLREEVICRTFGELMEWSEDKCWPKLRNLSTQSVFPSTYLLNSESEWSGRQKKKKEAELKKQRLVLKKQRLAEPSSLLPPQTIPLGRPSALAPNIQYRASILFSFAFYFSSFHSYL